LGDESFFPSKKEKLEDQGDYEIWNDGWGRIIRTRKQAYFSECIETVLKEPADLEKLIFEPAALESRYAGLDEAVANERVKGFCVYAKVGGIYCRSHFIRPEEDLLVDMALDEDFCNALFDRVSQHIESMALETLKRTHAYETGLFVYDDMASTYSNMFSPGMFEKYFLPRYQRIITACKEAGCQHVYLHSDGNIGPVLDLLLEAGFEGFNPLEPRSGLGLLKLREKYGKRMVLFGGICNTEILPRGDKKEIEAHVRPILELGRAGGIVLGMASVGDDVSPEAYDFYMSLVEKYGQYT
jgi:uroporphyrinogen decarboxylase